MALHTRVLRLVLSGLMGALLVVSKQAMSGLPNLEPVSLLIILFALELPRETPGAITVFILLQGVLYGFGLWWVMYLYVWYLLALLAWLTLSTPWQRLSDPDAAKVYRHVVEMWRSGTLVIPQWQQITTLELDCITRDGLLLDFATAMTTARVRVKELNGKDLPGGRSVFTVRFEVKNVSELNAIRNRLLSIPDVVGARRGSN